MYIVPIAFLVAGITIIFSIYSLNGYANLNSYVSSNNVNLVFSHNNVTQIVNGSKVFVCSSTPLDNPTKTYCGNLYKLDFDPIHYIESANSFLIIDIGLLFLAMILYALDKYEPL